MSVPARDVVVFLTHIFDPEIERRFLKLQRECAPTSDVVLLTERGTTVPAGLRRFTERYDFATLKHTARSVIGDRIVPGNCHLRSIDYYRRFPDYRFYWFVEYDVVYTGDWGAFIASFAGDESDLLASLVRTLADEPDWNWRSAFSTAADELPEEQWVLAFLPIHRISARGLATVAAKVRDGWVGHFEVVLPSALGHAGLRLADLGGSGAWTPRDRVHRHYVDWPGLPYAGTVRYRPPIRLRPIRNMLYHPCKTAPPDTGPTVRARAMKAMLRHPRAAASYWLRILRLAVRRSAVS